VAASDDGGATYGAPYQFGRYRGIGVRIVALPGGADPEVGVLLVVEHYGSVWRSDDGAASFQKVGELPFLDQQSSMTDVAVGPDERLYVSGSVPGTDDEWVYRTVGPVVSAAVEAEAQPVNPPVVIGPGGGSFQFTVGLTNTTTLPMTFEAWSEVSGPLTLSPVVGPRPVTLPAGATVARTLVQQVPGAAPAGTYTYTVAAGDFPGSVLSSDFFTVVKQGSEGTGDGAEGWAMSGWDDAAASAATGLSVSPNPFAGRTTIRFTAPAAATARLAVYDVLGREVTVLLDGPVEAGSHAVVFEAGALPAGMYVWRLAVGGRVEGGRLTLLR
jgi:hypothetical protein